MRQRLKLKSFFMLLALLVGLAPPLPGSWTAEAQVRTSSGREISRQNVRNARHAAPQRAYRGNRNVNHVRRANPTVHRGHRGHVVHHRRPAHVVVVHPRRHWHRGGAIAAGAAIGFIAGASAVALAGPAPRSGYCWFYTTPARTTGFWDWCPR